jgi:hypothetical protein
MQIGVTCAVSGYADVSDLNLRRMQLGLQKTPILQINPLLLAA